MFDFFFHIFYDETKYENIILLTTFVEPNITIIVLLNENIFLKLFFFFFLKNSGGSILAFSKETSILEVNRQLRALTYWLLTNNKQTFKFLFHNSRTSEI